MTVRGPQPSEVIVDDPVMRTIAEHSGNRVNACTCPECGILGSHTSYCSHSAARDPSHPFNLDYMKGMALSFRGEWRHRGRPTGDRPTPPNRPYLELWPELEAITWPLPWPCHRRGCEYPIDTGRCMHCGVPADTGWFVADL